MSPSAKYLTFSRLLPRESVKVKLPLSFRGITETMRIRQRKHQIPHSPCVPEKTCIGFDLQSSVALGFWKIDVCHKSKSSSHQDSTK